MKIQNKQDFVKIIEKQMKVRGLTAYRICKDLGWQQSTLSRFRSGETDLVYDKMLTLLKYLDVKIEAII